MPKPEVPKIRDFTQLAKHIGYTIQTNYCSKIVVQTTLRKRHITQRHVIAQ